MYAYFKGIVEDIDNEKVVLEVSNIGYNIVMPADELSSLSVGSNVKIYTYFFHREDDVKLFGFLTKAKLEFFKKLTSVSGVGSKVAVNIMANVKEADMCSAIVTENITMLKSIPGIGPKMAAKIIFELKDKIGNDEIIKTAINNKKTDNDDNIKEALSALKVLGYTSKELSDIIKKEDFKNLSIEAIIKKCLKLLQK